MKLIILLAPIFILLTFTVVTTVSTQNGARIIGGQETKAGQYPFAAAIYVHTNDSKFFCGGAILNQNWIATSGHCVNNAVLFTIQIGSNELGGDDSNRQVVATSEYVVHPEFNPETLENDIGLIHLRMPIKYSTYIQPVYLPYLNISDGESVISIGWGQVNDSDGELSNNLRFVTTTALSNAECKLYYGNQISDNMVCVEGNFNEGTCTGDTGSPLLDLYMYRFHYIVGIASFISGNGCESTDPSGYTRVYPYVSWIHSVTSA